MIESRDKLDYIQALRALAVLMVVLYHYRGGLQLASHGYAGVDLFFVISGFIMVITTSGMQKPVNAAKTFVIKRLARIWPVYAVISLLYLCIMAPEFRILEPYDSFKWLVKSLIFWPSFLQMPIVKSGWTLTHEIFFYGIFALSMLAGRFRWLAFFAVVIFIMFGIPFIAGKTVSLLAAPGFEAHGWQGWAAVVTAPINWCFSIGVIVGLISLLKIHVKTPSLLLLHLFPLIALLVYLLHAAPIDHGVIWALTFGMLILLLDLLNNAMKSKSLE